MLDDKIVARSPLITDTRGVPVRRECRTFSVQRFMRSGLLWLLLSFAALGPAEGARFLNDYANTTNGITLTAGFIPDASRIMVGEPLFLSFVVSNRAAQTFQFSHVRNEVFTITATNAAGSSVKSRPRSRERSTSERADYSCRVTKPKRRPAMLPATSRARSGGHRPGCRSPNEMPHLPSGQWCSARSCCSKSSEN